MRLPVGRALETDPRIKATLAPAPSLPSPPPAHRPARRAGRKFGDLALEVDFFSVKKFLAKDFKDPEPNTEAAVRAPGAGTAEHAERQGLEPSRAPSDSCLQRGGRSAAPR